MKIAVIGQGYVGLPLSIAFAEKHTVFGFDTNKKRIQELKNGYDSNCDVDLFNHDKLPTFTSIQEEIEDCKVFIITVPTPIHEDKTPNFDALHSASSMVGKMLKPQGVVVFESTVYPGCTEELCLPIIERVSGLDVNKDFYLGYSPERVNPGDNVNTLKNIKKITSGSNLKAAAIVDEMYRGIIDAGTVSVSSIKIAEAAKLIENCQRDVNIGFMNSVCVLFNKIGISTNEVIEAASTKWNFLKFTPGLVGGHCISVDPYYLLHLANKENTPLNMIEAARDANEYFSLHVSRVVVSALLKKKINPSTATISVYGASFKENCSDIRNSKSFYLAKELIETWGLKTKLVDQRVNSGEAFAEFGLRVNRSLSNKSEVIIVAVNHEEFAKDLRKSLNKCPRRILLFDIKGTFENFNPSIIEVVRF